MTIYYIYQETHIPTATAIDVEKTSKPQGTVDDAPRAARVGSPRCLNIAGIENFKDLQGALPRAWSLPQLTEVIRYVVFLCIYILLEKEQTNVISVMKFFAYLFRPGLEPPLLQQAAFDELVYEVDIMRNMATRHTQDEKEAQEKEAFRRPSLPVGSLFFGGKLLSPLSFDS